MYGIYQQDEDDIYRDLEEERIRRQRLRRRLTTPTSLDPPSYWDPIDDEEEADDE